jgi:hypothetical protein
MDPSKKSCARIKNETFQSFRKHSSTYLVVLVNVTRVLELTSYDLNIDTAAFWRHTNHASTSIIFVFVT